MRSKTILWGNGGHGWEPVEHLYAEEATPRYMSYLLHEYKLALGPEWRLEWRQDDDA